jgi:F0F1-type ATP synthase assembly protein I
MTNIIMLQYRNYFVVLFMLGYIPDCITMIFGILAYRNVQQIAYRTVPLVRRELDKQLTTMVLVQVVINLFTNVPCVTMGVVLYVTSGLTNASALDTIQFVYAVTLVISYTYFAVSKI